MRNLRSCRSAVKGSAVKSSLMAGKVLKPVNRLQTRSAQSKTDSSETVAGKKRSGPKRKLKKNDISVEKTPSTNVTRKPDDFSEAKVETLSVEEMENSRPGTRSSVKRGSIKVPAKTRNAKTGKKNTRGEAAKSTSAVDISATENSSEIAGEIGTPVGSEPKLEESGLKQVSEIPEEESEPMYEDTILNKSLEKKSPCVIGAKSFYNKGASSDLNEAENIKERLDEMSFTKRSSFKITPVEERVVAKTRKVKKRVAIKAFKTKSKKMVGNQCCRNSASSLSKLKDVKYSILSLGRESRPAVIGKNKFFKHHIPASKFAIYYVGGVMKVAPHAPPATSKGPIDFDFKNDNISHVAQEGGKCDSFGLESVDDLQRTGISRANVSEHLNLRKRKSTPTAINTKKRRRASSWRYADEGSAVTESLSGRPLELPDISLQVLPKVPRVTTPKARSIVRTRAEKLQQTTPSESMKTTLRTSTPAAKTSEDHHGAASSQPVNLITSFVQDKTTVSKSSLKRLQTTPARTTRRTLEVASRGSSAAVQLTAPTSNTIKFTEFRMPDGTIRKNPIICLVRLVPDSRKSTDQSMIDQNVSRFEPSGRDSPDSFDDPGICHSPSPSLTASPNRSVTPPRSFTRSVAQASVVQSSAGRTPIPKTRNRRILTPGVTPTSSTQIPSTSLQTPPVRSRKPLNQFAASRQQVTPVVPKVTVRKPENPAENAFGFDRKRFTDFKRKSKTATDTNVGTAGQGTTDVEKVESTSQVPFIVVSSPEKRPKELTLNIAAPRDNQLSIITAFERSTAREITSTPMKAGPLRGVAGTHQPKAPRFRLAELPKTSTPWEGKRIKTFYGKSSSQENNDGFSGFRRFIDRSGTRQLQIDAGQERYGAMECKTCGMVYSQGEAEDEKEHRKFHKEVESALVVKDMKSCRVVDVVENVGRVIVITARDSKRVRVKIENVIKLANKTVGLDEEALRIDSENDCQRTFFILVHESQKIVSIVGSEPCTQAQRTLPGEELLVDDQQILPAKQSICFMWTHPPFRKQGLAALLLFKLRAYLAGPGNQPLTFDEISFADVTRDLQKFVIAVSEKKTFLVTKQ